MSVKALVVLSGGQDSTTCLFWAKALRWDVSAITFDYGQRHKRELESANVVAQLAGIAHKHHVVHVGDVLKGTSPLVNELSKLEQYEDYNSLPGGLEKTFVPMRNQFFLTLAANRAYCLGISDLVTGVCQEDSGGYPDCRQEFITSFEKTCNYGTFTNSPLTARSLYIHTPLMNMTKAESVHLALSLPGCYQALAYTHTSYDGAYPPKGMDHATLLRSKGFAEAGIPDPLILRAVNEGLMDIPIAANYSGDLDYYFTLIFGSLWTSSHTR